MTAAIFGDGHDHVAGRLLYRHKDERRWKSVAMVAKGNDLWSASFTADRLGSWQYAVQGWVDHFETWCADLEKRLKAQPDPAKPDANATAQDIPLALRTGAKLLEAIAKRAKGPDQLTFHEVKLSLEWMAAQDAAIYAYPLSDGICEVAAKYFDPDMATRSDDVDVWVDRERARYSTWYELFPRSAAV